MELSKVLATNDRIYWKSVDMLMEIAGSASIVTDLKWVNEHIYWEHGEIDPKLTTGAFGAIIENLISQIAGIESLLSFLDRPYDNPDISIEEIEKSQAKESDIYLLSDEKED